MEDISREVIELAQAGDIAAFEKIYRATSSFVYNVALRITHNQQEAQDVTQEVFLKIYHSLKGFQFRSSFTTWAYRIAMNTALTAYQRISRERNRRQDFDDVIDTKAASVEPERRLEHREEHKRQAESVEYLLMKLNPDQRACIVLREIQGLSYEEISRALKININTVRTRLNRAREALVALAGKRGEL